MILTLVPEIGADGQDGATDTADPRLVIDVAVSGRYRGRSVVPLGLVQGLYRATATRQ